MPLQLRFVDNAERMVFPSILDTARKEKIAVSIATCLLISDWSRYGEAFVSKRVTISAKVIS